MVIISGTGRSETSLIHSLLTKLGADVGVHEVRAGLDGAVGGYRVLNRLINTVEEYSIFNQVRHPLEVIRSSYSSKNLIDYPEFQIFYKKYTHKEKYLMDCWLHMNMSLISMSKISYTLEHLNKGSVTEDLISAFNLKCTPKEFNSTLKILRADVSKNNTRKHKPQYGSHITEDLLNKIDKVTYDNCLSVYNKINSNYAY